MSKSSRFLCRNAHSLFCTVTNQNNNFSSLRNTRKLYIRSRLFSIVEYLILIILLILPKTIRKLKSNCNKMRIIHIFRDFLQYSTAFITEHHIPQKKYSFEPR